MNKTHLKDRSFALGTTSFIFPDHIIPNVKRLGQVFDEIELLVFESRPKEVLPSKDEIQELLGLSRSLNLSFNIHLPTDVSLSCESFTLRRAAADTLLTVLDLFVPLSPTTHTLHLEMPADLKKDPGNSEKFKVWEENTCQGLEMVLSRIPDPGIISIETLDYPFCLVESLVDQFNLSVCIDAGHQIKYGHNLMKTFEKHHSRTPLVHLHGVDFSGETRKDHLSLDLLPEPYMAQVHTLLQTYAGVVSLEVFNLENLNRSLGCLSGFFNNILSPINSK